MGLDDDIPATDSAEPSAPLLLQGFITEQEYARQRGVSVRTCQRDRAMRKSPPYCALGKQIFYRVSAVREWLADSDEVARAFRDDAAHGFRHDVAQGVCLAGC
jgi:hypothetical protein